MLKLFRRKKEDKEVIVDETGNEVEIEDELIEEPSEVEEVEKVEETEVEEIKEDEETPIEEEPKEEVVATETDSEEPVAEENKEIDDDKVKALEIEIETLKAEIEALKNVQVMTDEPKEELESFGVTYEPHFTGSESNKKPRF